MILLLSTWFVLCSVSYTVALFFTLVLIFIDIEHSLCLSVWFCFYQLGLCSVSYTATLFITLVLIFIDIEHSLCLLVWFCFYQLGLCSVIQLLYFSLWYWYLLIWNIHFVCRYDFAFINLVCVQSVTQLLYLSLWYWYLLISNIHFVCWYDFAFVNLVCTVFSQLYSCSIFHFGIDIYWYGTFTLSAGMILLLSTWFVFSQLYSYSIFHFGIDIYWYRTFTLSVGMILLLSTWFVLSQLYSYSIYHFGIIIKDFFISFSTVIIAQDIKTVNFYVFFVCKPTILYTGRPSCVQADLLCYFLLNKNQRRWRRSDHSYLGRTQKFYLFWPKSYISKFWLDQSDCLIRFFQMVGPILLSFHHPWKGCTFQGSSIVFSSYTFLQPNLSVL